MHIPLHASCSLCSLQKQHWMKFSKSFQNKITLCEKYMSTEPVLENAEKFIAKLPCLHVFDLR